jgi:trehalose 6-phosphate phosphatase
VSGPADAAVPPALAPLVAAPADAALFLDFDGTLAAIVPDPADAVALPGVPALLARLAAKYPLVAVVSGRPVAFVEEALDGAPGLHLAGLYGMEERLPDGVRSEPAGLADWRAVVAETAARLHARAPDGLGIEEKGLAVTLHYRTRPDLEDWAARFVAGEHDRSGLVALPGRLAVELRPPVEVDKGTVVERLGAGHRGAAGFGDDLGDLPAFAALDRLRARGATVVKVAAVDAESPPEVAAAADLVVEGPEGAVALLAAMAR